MTEEGHDEDGIEELGFPHKTLERAVTQLRQELNDCHAELEITKRLSPAPAVNRRQSRFTSTRPQGAWENLIGISTVRNVKQVCV